MEKAENLNVPKSSTFENFRDEDISPVKKFVGNCLTSFSKGDDTHYNHLVGLLTQQDDQDTLWRVYKALGFCVTTISKSDGEHHAGLVHALFLYSWASPDQVSAAFVDLVRSLISANGTFFVPSVKNLAHAFTTLPALPDTDAAEKERRLAWTHKALATFLLLAPSGNRELMAALKFAFPHKRFDKEKQVGYVRQLLTVATYVPTLEARILGLVLEKSLDLDVEIKITDAGEAVRDDEDTELPFFELEDLCHRTTSLDAAGQEEVDEMADKLDGVMLLVFEYIEAQVMLQQEAGKRLFISLWEVFEKSILNTYRSKYVQFALFLLCGKHPALSEQFLAHLLEIVMSEETPVYTRQSALAYVASFLARASFIHPCLLRTSFISLVRWIEQYLNWWEHSPQPPGGFANGTPVKDKEGLPDTPHEGRSHSMFYYFCQACFYVMCFHGSVLAASSQNLEENLDPHFWEKLVSSNLRPLNHCLESVRREFARLCQNLNLVSETTIQRIKQTIESKPKTIIALTNNREEQEANPLDSFFPFDPYLLCHSHKHIAGMYHHWQAWSSLTRNNSTNEMTSDSEASTSDSESEGNGDNNKADQDVNEIVAHMKEDMAISYEAAESSIRKMSLMDASPPRENGFIVSPSSSLEDHHDMTHWEQESPSHDMGTGKTVNSHDHHRYEEEGW